jgi:cell wall-associated NlpC family hydrolase
MRQMITRIAVVLALALELLPIASASASRLPHPTHWSVVPSHKKQHRKHTHRRAKPHRKPPLGVRAARLALRYLGVRYAWGGASPRQGFDCSGLVMYVYGRLGVRLPHYTVSQYRYGRRVGYSRLAPGDLVFFYGLNHVGMYVGKGRFIDAPHSGAVVRLTPLAGRRSSFYGARRLAAA